MIIVDVETTGLSPARHSLVSIGAVEFSKPDNQFYGDCRIWEGAEVDPEALAINGFTDGYVRTHPVSLEELTCRFLDWAQGIPERTLGGENVQFDQKFLTAAGERAKQGWIFGYRMVDLHALSYASHLELFGEVPLKKGTSALGLDATLRYVGLPPEPTQHHALTGARMEAEAFSRLIFKKGLLKEFSSYPIPEIGTPKMRSLLDLFRILRG